MPETHLIDLGITKNYWGYELGLNINNILDENYEAPHGFNQNGRNLSFIFKKSILRSSLLKLYADLNQRCWSEAGNIEFI